jgi:sugar lactone lactonase YvrE
MKKGRATLAVLVLSAVCVAGATAGQEASTAGRTYKKVGSWGKAGTGNGQFNNAFGLATDKAGNVYVADSDNRRVQVFTSKGTFVRKMAQTDTSVLDVAIDPEGNVWTTNDTGAQARQYSPAGAPLASIDTPKGALGIAVDAEGHVFVSTAGDNIAEVVRYDKTATGYSAGKTWGGIQSPQDVEVSPDGSVYVADTRGAPPNVKRYDVNGRLLKKINMKLPATAGAGVILGIGVDLDCNVWAVNAPERNVMLYSPTGKLLATATSGDLLAEDIAVGPTGDLYVYDISTHSVIRFAEDKSKPATANVPGRIVVAHGKATVRYGATAFACPAKVAAVATLSGKGVSGRAALQVAAGKFTPIAMAVKGPAGKTVPATFTIVLKTNGRSTTEKKSVLVSFGR